MKIEILGTGCKKCKTLYELAEQAANELDLDCEIEKVTDLTKIMSYNVIATPGLVVDGEVKLMGRLPKLDELKEMIK